MDLKAKLVELLDEAEEWADHKCDELDCETCPADKMKGNCVQQLMVDRLIAHGATVQEWISVKDRLPEKNTDVLIYNIEEYMGTDFLTKEGKWFWNEELPPTHWMPLPEPPKGEDTP